MLGENEQGKRRELVLPALVLCALALCALVRTIAALASEACFERSKE